MSGYVHPFAAESVRGEYAPLRLWCGDVNAEKTTWIVKTPMGEVIEPDRRRGSLSEGWLVTTDEFVLDTLWPETESEREKRRRRERSVARSAAVPG